MDFKYKSIEAMADKSIFATLLNGAIRTSEEEHLAGLLRCKSQYLIAYGACACMGGIPALANQFPREQILKFSYEDSPSTVNPGKTRPQIAFRGRGLHAAPARVPQRRPHAGSGRGRGLLHPRLSADAESDQGRVRRPA